MTAQALQLKRIRVYEHDMKSTIARLEDEVARLFLRAGSLIDGRVVFATSSVTALAGDFISYGALTAAVGVTLPASPQIGARVTVKAAPNSTDYHVTVNGNGVNIDGETDFTLDCDHMCAAFLYDSNSWRVW